MSTIQSQKTLRYLRKTQNIPDCIIINISENKILLKSTQMNENKLNGKHLVKNKSEAYYYGAFKNELPEDKACIYIFPDGSYYQGQIHEGKFNGKGNLIHRYDQFVKFCYEGEWKQGQPHGKGTEKIHNSITYNGQFKHGKKHGYGRMDYLDGSKFEGFFQNNKINGEGTYTTKAHLWKGIWKDGYLEGKGEQTSFDENDQNAKAYYKGNFSKGQKNGQGVYTWGQNISVYNGTFKDGQLDGKGRLNIGGVQFVGEWKKGIDIKVDIPNSQIHFKRDKNI